MFEQAVSSGGINPKMTRDDAMQLVQWATPGRPSRPRRPRAAPSRPRHEPEIVPELSEEEEGGALPEIVVELGAEAFSRRVEEEGGFLRRMDIAKAYARLPYTGEVTDEIIELARSVAEAWDELASKFEEQRIEEQRRALN